jgi:hypothetical protein
LQVRIVNDEGPEARLDEDEAAELVEAGIIYPAENDEGEPIPGTFQIDSDLLDEWSDQNPPLDADDVALLPRWMPLLRKTGPLSDAEALDLINYALSAPSWSVSFLEDIAEIIRDRTDRKEIRGATWASH